MALAGVAFGNVEVDGNDVIRPGWPKQHAQRWTQANAACNQVNWAMAIRMVMMVPRRASVPTVQRVMVLMCLYI